MFLSLGHTEAIATIETVIDHVATHLKKDPLEVREVNLVPDETAEKGGPNTFKNSILPLLKQTGMIEERKAEVKAFNQVKKKFSSI